MPVIPATREAEAEELLGSHFPLATVTVDAPVRTQAMGTEPCLPTVDMECE